jgi:putative ATP-dependent endonuclease of OLD family
MLDALRDAENQLGSWRSSPLRPLLEEAVGEVPAADLDAVTTDLATANNKLVSFQAIAALEQSLRLQIADLAGPKQDIHAKLGFAPIDARRVFRSIAFLIDEGKRGISEASLGSANMALLALKLAEFAWRKETNDRNFTVLCVEEPEAHLHPHMQRTIFNKLFQNANAGQSLIVTTHSPTIASTAMLRSVVLLRSHKGATYGFSLANLSVTESELDDLERYLTATRAELLFARGIIFVEGDAEEALLPVFATSIGIDLDDLGVTVCNVGGVNFRPYVKLAMKLGLPWSVITDWDPILNGQPLGIRRTLDLNDDMRIHGGQPPLAPPQRDQIAAQPITQFQATFAPHGIFLNNHTFEVAVAQTPALLNPLLDILAAQEFGAVRTARLAAWRANPATVDAGQLLAIISDIGKGRLSGKLAQAVAGFAPPAYIADAINYVATRV